MPLTIMMLLFSARAGAIAQRIGPRIPMTVGPLLCAAGFALLTRVEPGVSYVSGVLPGILVFATGLTLTVAPLTTTALSSVAAHLAGVASGVNNAVARTGQPRRRGGDPGRRRVHRRRGGRRRHAARRLRQGAVGERRRRRRRWDRVGGVGPPDRT